MKIMNLRFPQTNLILVIKKLDEKIKDEIENMKRPNQNRVFAILRNLNKSGTIINR